MAHVHMLVNSITTGLVEEQYCHVNVELPKNSLFLCFWKPNCLNKVRLKHYLNTASNPLHAGVVHVHTSAMLS